MAVNFSVTVVAVSDILQTRLEDDFAGAYGYRSEIPDPENPGQVIPNPMSKTDFLRAQIENYIVEVVAGYEARVVGEMAVSEALSNARSAFA